MDIEFARGNGCLVARPFVEKLDYSVCGEFKERVQRRLSGLEPPKLVMDLRDVGFLDSMAIGALVGLRNLVSSAGGEVVLCNLEQNVANVLRVVTVDAVFEVREDLSKALEHLCIGSETER